MRGCKTDVKIYKIETNDHWQTLVCLSLANASMVDRVIWSLKELCEIVHNYNLDLVTKGFPFNVK